MKTLFSRYPIIFVVLVLILMTVMMGNTAKAGVIAGIRGGYYYASGWADTHDLIYDGSGAFVFGFEVGYTFHSPLEIALGVDFISKDGQRVWPDDDGGWESDGHSISYDMMPITLVARYRFLRERTFSPYLGAGAGYIRFQESMESSKDGEGFLLQAGGDYYLHKRAKIYAELEWSTYPSVIGNAGASRYFNEDDLGGLTGRIGVRFTF